MTQILTFEHSPFELHAAFDPAGDQPKDAGLFPGDASGLFLQPSGGVYPACDPGGDL